MADVFSAQVQFPDCFAQHDPGGDPRHGYTAHFRDQGNGPRRPGVRLKDVDHVVRDRVLYVHQALDFQLNGDPSRVFFNRLNVLFGDVDRGDDACRVSRMDPCKLDVLHDCGNERLDAVADCVRLGLYRVVEKLVDKDGTFRRNVNSGVDVALEHLFMVNDFHCPSAQNIRGTDHERIPDAVRDGNGLFDRAGHARLGLRDAELAHHVAEVLPVLGQVNRLGRCAQNGDAVLFQLAGYVERCLAPELDNNAFGFFFFINAQHVFNSERLEVQLVRGVVVR